MEICKKAHKQWSLCAFGGDFDLTSRADKIRTCDPYVPNVVRYRAALLPENSSFGE